MAIDNNSNVGSPSRRQLLSIAAPLTLAFLTGCRDGNQKIQSYSDLQKLLDQAVKDPAIPGVSAALVKGEQLLWKGAAGFADIGRAIAMNDNHLLNIGSITKIVTATAVMQQVENGKLSLNNDINDYLPFSVRNPKFPDAPITIRHLLVHRSSITDGPAYGVSYACGDPVIALGDWIEGYLKPGGKYFHAQQNFLNWAPGTDNPVTPPRTYSNVAFGLLGYLVEKISGQKFDTYCQAKVFDVLGMTKSRWHIGDESEHAIPYSYIDKKIEFDEETRLENHLFSKSVTESDVFKGAVIPHCLYSFYNFPDGLLRTNPAELSALLRAFIGGGQLNGKRILKKETVDLMLSTQHEGRGLGWAIGESSGGGHVYLHGGGDPGISTLMLFRERDSAGAIVLFNCSRPGDSMDDIVSGMMTLVSNLEEENRSE